MSLGPIFGAIDVAIPSQDHARIPIVDVGSPIDLAALDPNRPVVPDGGWDPGTGLDVEPWPEDPYVDVDPFDARPVGIPPGPPPGVDTWPPVETGVLDGQPIPFAPPEEGAGELPIPVEPDGGIGDGAAPAEGPEPDAARGIEALDTGDHITQSARGWMLPGLAGGLLGGTMLALSMPAGPGRGAAFGIKVIGGVAGGMLTGGAAGLLVAASKPSQGDSLTTRYALASGAVGALGGALLPGGQGRVAAAALGGISSAVVGGFIGNRMQRVAEGG